MNKHLIEMKNINKTYLGKIKVLVNLNFCCDKGEFVAILGKSGSGKTTLMNIIGQLDTDYDGTYLFDKEDVKLKNHQYIGKDIAFIFQNYQLIDNLSVYDNVYLPYIYTDDNDKNINERIEVILKQLGIQMLKDKKISTLSGGEKQRVAIARSLLLNVKLIIADEPTGNLDSENERIVVETLKKISKLNTAVILITHNEYLSKYADRCLYLKDGSLYEQK